MASPDQIADALLARCASLSIGSPALPVAMPDRDPPEHDGRFVEVSAFFNRPAWEGLSSGKVDQGLLQISVVWPRNRGIVAPMRIATAVMAHFPKALQLANGVKISGEPWAASPLIEDRETRVPVTIPWTA